MDKSYVGRQKTQLHPNTDFGMAQDEYNANKRYGLKPGSSDSYLGVTFALTPKGNYRVEKPSAIAGEYTTRKILMSVIDAFAEANDQDAKCN